MTYLRFTDQTDNSCLVAYYYISVFRLNFPIVRNLNILYYKWIKIIFNFLYQHGVLTTYGFVFNAFIIISLNVLISIKIIEFIWNLYNINMCALHLCFQLKYYGY